MKPPFPKTTKNSNPFTKTSISDELETASHFTSSSFQTPRHRNTRDNVTDFKKSDRRMKCEEAVKIRHLVERKKSIVAPQEQ